MIEPTSSASIASMLAQIRQYETRAKAGVGGVDVPALPIDQSAPTKPSGSVNFGGLVKGAVDSVNDLQQRAKELSTAFDQGKEVPLTDVVLAMQKSSVAFEATLQIRNKVIKAYEDIRNMPV